MTDFFRTLYPVPSHIINIHRMFVEVAEGFDLAAARGNKIAARQARLVLAAHADFNLDLEKISERITLIANQIIPELFDQARVGRPHLGGVSMRSALDTSEPIQTPLPAATVGIVNLLPLDLFEYWRTQEFGSDHLVGHELHGLFYPGGEPADPAQFRVHALFTPGAGAPMTVHNPIPEGRFIRDGIDHLEKYYDAQLAAAGADAIIDLRAAEGLGRGGVRLTRGDRTRKFERSYTRIRESRGNPASLGAILRRL